MQQDFRSHSDIDRTDVERVEYLLSRGRKQLQLLQSKGVKKVNFVTPKSH